MHSLGLIFLICSKQNMGFQLLNFPFELGYPPFKPVQPRFCDVFSPERRSSLLHYSALHQNSFFFFHLAVLYAEKPLRNEVFLD